MEGKQTDARVLLFTYQSYLADCLRGSNFFAIDLDTDNTNFTCATSRELCLLVFRQI